MRTIEALGFAKDEFKTLYAACNGFNSEAGNSENAKQTTDFAYELKENVRNFITEEPELAKTIIEGGR